MTAAVPFIILGVELAAMGIGAVCQILKPDTVEQNKEIHYYLSNETDPTIPANNFRLVIVNQKKSWNKAVRVYNKGTNDYFEVKCGDSTGKVAKCNENIKFDAVNVPFDGVHEVHLCAMRPGTLGVWSTIIDTKIPLGDMKKYAGKTVYYFFDNDADRYFATDRNRMTYNNLV
ncbi:hypothetical protein RB653_005187 [Dictyostelium firmibasis]|uniref:Uncharacterized protein n=1 Tax=Dictyostelium firmibasis TaxID=79012 RepID=A0AAN7U0T8_9MYCE